MEREPQKSVQVLETPKRTECEQTPDYILVVDPYALNIIDNGPRKGEARLSFYSSFVINAARKRIESGWLENGKVILFGDASFGEDYPSTGDLMKDYLTRERPGGPILSEDKIVLFNGPDMNQTSTQIKRLAQYLKEQGIEGQPVDYLGFEYHKERVMNHSRGYGVNIDYYMTPEIVHLYDDPNFDYVKLREVLPYDEIEEMEAPRRKVSRFDKKGLIPRLAKPILGGSFMLDNYRKPDGTLGFEYKPGKQKLKELGLV